MSGKMKVVTLLLVFLTVSGYSYVLQPRLKVTQISGLDRDHQSDVRSEQPRDVSISVDERVKPAESAERRKTEEEQRSEGLTPETNPEKKKTEGKITAGFVRNTGEILDINKGHESLTPGTFSKKLGEERKRGEHSVADMVRDLDTDKEDLETNEESKTVKEILTDNKKTWEAVKYTNSQKRRRDDETQEKFMKNDQMDKMKQEMEEEERESKLVAGISLHMETRGEENIEGKRGEGEDVKHANYNDFVEREKEDHRVVSHLTPPLSTSSTQFEIPATIQIITQSSNPPLHHHNGPPSVPPTPHAKVGPQFFPPSVTLPTHTTVSTVTHGEVTSVSLLEELLAEVLHGPGHHLKQNELEVKAGPSLEDVMVKNILFKPAQKEPKEGESNPKVQAATPEPAEAKFITKDLNTTEPHSAPKFDENAVTQATGKPRTAKLTDNDTKLAVNRNKASLTKPAAKTQLTTAKTPSQRPTKINTSSKNKTVKSKEKKSKKNNKTQKPPEKKKKVTTPTHFPYFMDNYCPPECACYGRVVQCSDKGVDKVPYGIPYNARYILLMNNHINSIQLDLLNEYVSMEFLVLSNNQLTDGSIEGAFEGIPALKRLYLDRNLLESIPTDLPLSLEELRLDNNQLSVMSEAAWARCPNLLVLSLSNNSLGNGSNSLHNAVLSPLCNLRTLNLDHNQLTSVPLGLPLTIKELYLKGNLIEQFHAGVFSGISELVVLDLSANRLTNKGFIRESLLNATHLESLNLEGNRLKQVPRHLPRSLKTLNLEGNLISSVKKAALSSLKHLEHLGLARNKIFKVAPGAFKALPALHQLDMCHNNLRQVPRQLPPALHSVALTHNKIHSVPRDAFCWGNNSESLSGLVRVQLEHNLIDMGKLDAKAFRCLRGFQVVHFY